MVWGPIFVTHPMPGVKILDSHLFVLFCQVAQMARGEHVFD
jgi:hypothetical protein